MSTALEAPHAAPARKPAAVFRIPDVRLSAALRLWQRNASIYRRTYKMNILPNFFEPFFYLLAMGLGLGAYLSKIQGVRYLDFIAPGLVATAAMFGTSFEVTFNCFVKMQFVLLDQAHVIAAAHESSHGMQVGKPRQVE